MEGARGEARGAVEGFGDGEHEPGVGGVDDACFCVLKVEMGVSGWVVRDRSSIDGDAAARQDAPGR